MAGTFISYRWESDAFRAAVREFALRLRQAGVEVALDQLYLEEHPGGPDEGWAEWCAKQVKRADRILAVCSPGWFRCFEGNQPPGEGLGAAFEARLIYNQLYESAWRSGKHRLVTLADQESGEVPLDLRQIHRFASEREFEGMVEWLGVPSALERETEEGDAPRWPEPLGEFAPEFADRDEVWVAISRVMAGRAQRRIVIVEGSSNHGKSVLLRESVRYAQQAGLSVARVDFKGGHRSVADVLAEIDLALGERLPEFNETGGRDSFALRRSLRALAAPLLLVFDTYEQAILNAELTEWIEHQLMADVEHSESLAILLAGQECPRPDDRSWSRWARFFELGPILDAELWESWVERHFPALLRAEFDVRTLVSATAGVPGNMATTCRAMADRIEGENG